MEREDKLFSSEFDDRTAANMEAALERVCRRLPADRQDHATRRFVAERIIDAARKGHRTLDEFISAGMQALSQLP